MQTAKTQNFISLSPSPTATIADEIEIDGVHFVTNVHSAYGDVLLQDDDKDEDEPSMDRQQSRSPKSFERNRRDESSAVSTDYRHWSFSDT